MLASMGTVSALTPDTAATGPSSVAGAKEDIGQKSVTALESHRAEPRQTAGRHQGNGIAAYDFAPDSLLVTQDGLRPIEQIRLGDWVWAYDETTGVNSLKEVVRTFARDTDWVVILEIGNEVVQATLEHPFWQDGIGWRRAGELTAGDRVQSISGVPATVTHAEHRLAPQPVFNIEVTDAHTYFVSPTKLLVHNACKVYAVKGGQFTDKAGRLRNADGTFAPTGKPLSPSFDTDKARRAWEQANGRSWPTDPRTGRPFDAHHIERRSDGGALYDPKNIVPVHPEMHKRLHHPDSGLYPP
jgi:hypothetical protein